tara:strand:- start:84 stop:335 length:252 start_codon:yes stop_codon:yes gene_type:complete
MKIVFKTPGSDGGVSIISPAERYNTQAGCERLANRDIPKGTPYEIVQDSEVPQDRAFRNAWEVSMPNPDGTSIGRKAYDEANP